VKKLFVFIGDSGSGKTTLVNELTKRYPEKFKKITTCTSRALRKDEVNKVDYNLLPKEYFINNPDLVLTKRTENGDYYGTRKVDLFSETHHLLLTSRPTGISKLISLGFNNIIVVRIRISKTLKIERMKQRGDNDQMISERLKLEDQISMDFNFADIQTIELDAVQSIDEKMEFILRAC